MAGSERELVAAIREGGQRRPLYLVTGETLLAEAAGKRLAEALASDAASVQIHRRPESLAGLIADLRTFSLFGGGKVMVAVESGVLADRRGAAHLLDQAEDALPVTAGEELTEAGRRAAGRLLQVCRLFDLAPYGGAPESVLAALPEWVFKGGKAPGSRQRAKSRTAAKAKELRDQLADLLSAAAAEGLEGWAESDAADLSGLVREGLPEGHHLVLCEIAVAADHPLVGSLRKADALLELAEVTVDRRGAWHGLDALVAELEEETGKAIAGPALDELARRTLRVAAARGGRGQERRLEADSGIRFAGEYRKLASLAKGATIDLDLVRDAVEDRGEQDSFELLDAIGEGRVGEALTAMERFIEGADDDVAGRLLFFGQLAGFCRRLTAVDGMMKATGLAPGERNYNRFRSTHAPRLKAAPPGVAEAPLKSLHDYPLHKAYLAASRFPEGRLSELPGRVLETEMRLKGESGDPHAALAELLAWVATAGSGA